jgi:predicted  nucleic acid-binding Zn-ribbon protein
MSPDIQLASRIQEVDQKCASLEKEIAALPRYIADIEKKLETHRKQVDADKGALAANLKERKTLEGTIADSQAKISKLKDQMTSAKTNEQYQAFQKEITHFGEVISKSEDRILELMESGETLDAAVKKSDGELAVERKHVEGQKTKARERAAADQKAIAEAKLKRAELVKQIDPAVYKAYEYVKKKVGVNVVCEVVDGTCTGCRLALRPQFYQELKFAKDVRYCENCQRIVFFNAPVAPPV